MKIGSIIIVYAWQGIYAVEITRICNDGIYGRFKSKISELDDWFQIEFTSVDGFFPFEDITSIKVI